MRGERSCKSEGLLCEEEWWDGENEGEGWEVLYPSDSTNDIIP